MQNLKDLDSYNPGEVKDKVLFDDWRWILTFYANVKSGKQLKYSEELIKQKGVEILKEILNRIDKGVNFSFNVSKMQDTSREFLAKISTELSDDEKTILKESTVEYDIKDKLDNKIVIEDFITVVGSLPNWSSTTGDIDVLIKVNEGSDLFNLAKESFASQFEDNVKRRLSFHQERFSGPFTSHFHLYDLVIVPKLIKNFMPTLPGNKPISDEVLTISILDNLKPLVLKENFVRRNDNSWLISANKFSDLFLNVSFDLSRAFPREITNEFSYEEDYTDSGDGVFDLVAVPKSIQLHEMAKKLTLFKPIVQQKPTHGREVGEPYTIESLVNATNRVWDDWNETGCFVGTKRDGVTVNVSWKDGEVKIFTEEKLEVTGNLPSLVKEIGERKDSGLLIGELELYIDGKHQPRADSSAVVNNLNAELEKHMRLTAYDLFNYNEKDLYELPYSERRNQLTKLNESKNFQISQPEFLVYDEKDLIAAVKKSSSTTYSEGAMLKKADMNYEFDVNPSKPSMIKYKNEYQVTVRVIDVEPVEGAEAWVYIVGIDEEKKENKKTGGVYLGEKHARMIYEGKKSSVLKDREFPIMVGKAFYLAGDKIYGLIYFNKPTVIKTKKDFDDTASSHKITEEEFKKWNWEFPLFMYRFKFIPARRPRDYEREKGVVNFIREVKFI